MWWCPCGSFQFGELFSDGLHIPQHFFFFPGVTQQKSGVINGGHIKISLFHPFPVLFCNLEIGFDEFGGRNAPQTDNHLGADDAHLLAQMADAGGFFFRERVAVVRRAAFDDVRNIYARTVEIDHFKHIVEQLTGGADERLALQILLLARSFADEHQLALGIADAENDVVPGFGQRAAAAAERKAVKANADFLYQKALHDNPALAHSNPISRFWQKQRIKKQYAKTLKAGGKVKKTAEATAKAAKKTAQETKRATFFVVRHWKGCLIVGGIAFIVLLLFGGLSSCSLFGGNSGSGLIASSYLSEDADITGAESAYAAMEAELQDMLNNIEREYPGYDEYRVNADEIEHDPYVLISILSALHEGVFTLDEAQSTLEMLFEKQYILTVEEEVQVRYRTETRTDSEGNEYEVEVPYNYYILHVDLENFNLSHVPVYIMGEEQLSMYAMYMSSLGNRPDLFPSSGYVSKYYENPPADYEVPAALLNSDEQFARLIEEADKYVGFPYVWGGSTPETSFDCSGFVSYVLTNSGLYNTGRLGAQGLYNISTRVSNPQPGDLVFFTGTYDTPGVSHVGIYVGEDGDGSPVMLHCGDPIQYAKLDTSYWQSHFYAYGRLHYN